MSGNGADDGDSRNEDRPVDGVSLSLDATFELLAHADRRVILRYLRDAPGESATRDELADHLASERAEQSGERPDRDRVLSTLHHVHVPKLVDAGVADYDARTGEIRYWGSDRLEEWHDRVRKREGT
ncbi:DUF7344 domain-containing protein [Halorussus aquaticus]|uniref:ArsR family transcriptional regulator n=1 Tax=Halorussus aquaticus TaxID=2953748 RepID=A0ABD5Q0D3_9EURY|nr:hypothetical protein [Halorussus aquaticus]